MTERAENFEIAIDARWLQTGLGTYTYNLIAGLRSARRAWSLRGIVSEKSALRVAHLCDSVRVLRAPIYTLREQVEIPRAARGTDLLHVPHFNAPLLYRGKLVVTVHDLTYLMDANEHSRLRTRVYARFMLNAAARRADHVITVSEFSRNNIVKILGIDPVKVTAIPNGVDPQFAPVKTERGISRSQLGGLPERPYFLYVGNLKPHKNLVRFLGAVTSFLKRTNLDWTFLIVGPGGENERKQLLDHASRLGISEVVSFMQNVTDEVLLELYRGAMFLVFPSLLEGFGLPVLEAMACGTPVLCSHVASLPEVGGDAVRYFNPLDIEDMSQALESVATCPQLREVLREKGLARASQFSWAESSRRHAELFERVIRN